MTYSLWTSSKNWRGTFTLPDNDEYIPNAYYAISGAKDALLNTMVAITTRSSINRLNVNTRSNTSKLISLFNKIIGR